jgi:hypothetical protein
LRASVAGLGVHHLGVSHNADQDMAGPSRDCGPIDVPVYHREYDAKLLLLTVSAGVMLWAEGSPIGRLALFLNTLGFVLTGNLTWAVLLGVINRLHSPATGLSHWILIARQVFPATLILLLISVFYLRVYARECSHSVLEAEAGI